MIIHKVEIAEICNGLKQIEKFDVNSFENERDDLYITALGFEDRSLDFTKIFSQSGKYKAKSSIILLHETNKVDNERKRAILESYLGTFVENGIIDITYNEDNYMEKYIECINELLGKQKNYKVSFDISGCSSQMIFSTLKILLESNTDLRVFYTEAEIYHPTKDEFHNHKKWLIDGSGPSQGILRVTESKLYPGRNVRELPVMLVAFPNFKPERTRSIKTELNPVKTIWIIGEPHLPENHWRRDAVHDVNEIKDDKIYNLKTFDYISTFCLMEEIYIGETYKWMAEDNPYHMIIAPHGSKLQNIGIALFCQLRQDVGVYFSTPEQFNPAHYTEGVLNNWQIKFNNTENILKLIKSCGKIRLIKNS